MTQKQAEKTRHAETEDIDQVEPKKLETPSSIDDIIDDIDSVLEDNALEFVRSYIQQGGQ